MTAETPEALDTEAQSVPEESDSAPPASTPPEGESEPNASPSSGESYATENPVFGFEFGVYGTNGLNMLFFQHYGVLPETTLTGMAVVPGAAALPEPPVLDTPTRVRPDDPLPETESPQIQKSTLFGISDTLFPLQWGLYNAASSGVDINVVKTWEHFTGDGVIIGIIDDAVEYSHPDLIPNYLPAYGYDAVDNTNDPSPRSGIFAHGTAVTSLAVAAKNGMGMVGVAYDASFSASATRYYDFDDLAEAADHTDYADVVNMSYGSSPGIGLPAHMSSYHDLANNGRLGKGAVLVKASGNDRESEYFNDGLDWHTHDPSFVVVGGVEQSGKYASFSSPTPAMLVTAPAQDIMTADIPGSGGYGSTSYGMGGGTSFSTPMVSGVAALMLEANPDLGYRDVHTILAMTARQTDNAVDDPNMPWTWQVNGADKWNGGGMHASHDYGFGLVDATAAVRLAESWDLPVQNMDNLYSVYGDSDPAAVQGYTPDQLMNSVPDPDFTLWGGGTYTIDIPDGGQVSNTINFTTNIEVEYVRVDMVFGGGDFSQLTAVLTSPERTDSWMLFDYPEANDVPAGDVYTPYYLGSVQCRGEQSQGDWTLTVSDNEIGTEHTLARWSITVYGSQPDVDDLYVFTDEYGELAAADPPRGSITDNGGIDTVNASAVSSASHIDLRDGAQSTIDGATMTLSAGTVIENCHTGDGDDIITGNSADNELFGWRGNDVLLGGSGNDLLFGGPGQDSLFGGTGSDTFHFEATGDQADVINDFSHTDDALSFNFAQFGQSEAGALSANNFFTDDADVNLDDDCFIFENDLLWYDSDGTGSNQQTLIAEINGEDIQTDDIFFV